MQATKCLAYVLCLGAVLITASPAQTNHANEEAQPRRAELQRALTALASWAKRYATKTGAVSGTRAVEEGIRLAKQRRAALGQLMESDPALALSAAIDGKLRSSLPAKVQAELEEPVNGMGDLLVFCAMPATGGGHGSGGIQRSVQLNGHTYRAAVYGRRLEQTTKHGIPLHGIALDGVLVLDQNVLAELQPDEIPAATVIKDLSAAAGPLAGSGPPVVARLGDRLYRFASADHLKHSEALLESAESAFGAQPSEPATTFLEQARFPEAELKTARRPLTALPPPAATEIKVLVIRVDFADMPGDPSPVGGGAPYTASSVQSIADSQIAPYYHNSSYGQVNMSFTVTPRVYRVPQTANYYATADYYDQLYNDATTAAGVDYTVTDYNVAVVLFSFLGFLPNSQFHFGGLTTIGSSMSLVNGEFDFRVVAHELGHTLGLYHANFWHTSDDDPFSDNGYSVEYGDVFDTMSANWPNDQRVDFNPWFKYLLGWIHDDQVQTVTQNGVYRVYRFDNAKATGTLALKLAKDDSSDYWIGFRRNFSENFELQHGAYVELGYPYPTHSDLLGLGATIDNPRDPGLVLGTTMADAQANVTVMTVAQGGAAPNEYLDVLVIFAPPPIITQQPDSQFALEGFAAQFSIQATGSSGYVWQRQAGDVGDWLTLSDGAGYAEVSTPNLQISQTTLLMNGHSFRCLLTNSAGGFNCSRAAALTVTPLGVGHRGPFTGSTGHDVAAHAQVVPVRSDEFEEEVEVDVEDVGVAQLLP
jgi:hypothetical protein